MHSIRLLFQARTDKNVHAGGNVIQMKLLVDEAAYPDDPQAALDALRDRMNNFLPEGITVLRLVTVGKGFHAKNCCAGRSYDYVFPTAALDAGVISDELLRKQEWLEADLEELRERRRLLKERQDRELAELEPQLRAQNQEEERKALEQLSAQKQDEGEGAEGNMEDEAGAAAVEAAEVGLWLSLSPCPCLVGRA